jgi:AcrR family transcriptional regulator
MSKYSQGVKRVKKNATNKTRTEKALMAAFQQLMTTTSFDKIRIQNITDLAEVNRHSFYNHFTDKYDLLYQTVSQMFLTDMTPQDGEALFDRFIHQIPLVLQYIEEHRLFFKSAFRNDKACSFHGFFQKMICDWLTDIQNGTQDLNEIESDPLYHTEIRFYIAGYSNLLIHWLYNEPNKPAQTLANEFIALLRKMNR